MSAFPTPVSAIPTDHHEALKKFFREVWDAAVNHVELDGSEIEELGLKLGLLVGVDVTEPCVEGGCSCSLADNIPGTCYRPAPDLAL